MQFLCSLPKIKYLVTIICTSTSRFSCSTVSGYFEGGGIRSAHLGVNNYVSHEEVFLKKRLFACAKLPCVTMSDVTDGQSAVNRAQYVSGAAR